MGEARRRKLATDGHDGPWHVLTYRVRGETDSSRAIVNLKAQPDIIGELGRPLGPLDYVNLSPVLSRDQLRRLEEELQQHIDRDPDWQLLSRVGSAQFNKQKAQRDR